MQAEYLPMVNRGVITVVPKKPFYDWINYLDPEHPINPEEIKEHNSYMVTDEIIDPVKVLKKRFKIIFENELLGMWLVEDDWPQRRTFKVFSEWFDCHVSAVVYDLGKTGIYSLE